MSQARSRREVAFFYYIRMRGEQWSAARLLRIIPDLNDSAGGISLIDILPPGLGNANVSAEDNQSYRRN
jgi:hypothetical protein